MLDGETRDRILIEVCLGAPAPEHESAEAREFRRITTKQVQDLRDRGIGVDIPPEIAG